ncbi:hypothetical protein PAAG_12460 [Paracoccidioides lutzii Pb01]|uniref:Glucose-methanol-choline oxidoreductase C-terminal domain-containing protein n=1 Tax=Paracoccidioides lutzii (strain ATCC MYA-826 / Pb01) TaxID=502779 RepID=A0A0A2V3B7_PARBA|nr:hypothetical protein PAAG_12460 [Paracoccidioides lutzii Pb01]KGQ00872.1 hypothetical protein PAAG_12460 [Paracoccidioides lutzii Pb01]
MFHLEYPFSRGWIHVNSPDPCETPDFDAGFMNDERDMAPMVWGYIKSRETARRTYSYAGEITSMHPHYPFDSPARALDIDLETTKAYAEPNHISAGNQHGSWAHQLKPGEQQGTNILNSNRRDLRKPLRYTKKNIEQIEKWSKIYTWMVPKIQTWHSFRTCSINPREGISVVKHSVLDERLNVHGVKGLKVSDPSVCSDNVGCNTFSTTFLISENCAVLTAEDLGYSGNALDMKVPPCHAPGEAVNLSRL